MRTLLCHATGGLVKGGGALWLTEVLRDVVSPSILTDTLSVLAFTSHFPCG